LAYLCDAYLTKDVVIAWMVPEIALIKELAVSRLSIVIFPTFSLLKNIFKSFIGIIEYKKYFVTTT
jgi:hypothetical protein